MFNEKNQLDDFFGLQPDLTPSGNKDLKDSLSKRDFQTKLRLLPHVLSFRERYLIFVFLLVTIGALVVIPVASYYHFTYAVAAEGGTLHEGIVGEPRLINPLLSQANDADRDLGALVYAGLLRYNDSGKLVPDLAKSYDISSDGLSYTFYLRDGLFWHDGQPLTADDIVFTIRTVQNPDYASPLLIDWEGVDVEKINDHTVIFKLKDVYGQFLNGLTLGIMPSHLWQEIKPINFNLSELNLKPVGAGPYQFAKLKKDKQGRIISYELTSNPFYHGGKPYIDKLQINFYTSEEELVAAHNSSAIESLGLISAKNIEAIQFKRRLSLEEIRMPGYIVLFFNQNQSKILSDKKVRLAINHAINRDELVARALSGHGIPVYAPLPAEIFDVPGDLQPTQYDPSLAENLLTEAGWEEKGSDGIRTKKNSSPAPTKSPLPKPSPSPIGGATDQQADNSDNRLSIRLTTSTWSELTEVATMIKERLAAVGIEVIIDTPPFSSLHQSIKDRDYQMLLFGEILKIDPDPMTFWHSSQKRGPGLNLALYENKSADKLLEDARKSLNPTDRARKYAEFQQLVIEDVPVAFLYSSLYVYGLGRNVHGFETSVVSMPSDRFSNISKWYINTKRVWK